MGTLKGKDLITIQDLGKEELLHILQTAQSLKNQPRPELLKGKILGSCFFEPSTRTRLSFESAVYRMGGRVIGFSGSDGTSASKGESLADTMRMIEHYADLVVLRHPLEGSAQLAADTINAPVINAGDGANQHPTQTLLDLFSIQETQGYIEGLNIALVGDLKHGRTVHSLAQALIHFKARLFFISPPSLEMPKGICDELREEGIKFSFHKSLEEVLPKLDILYMTRIQEERFVQHEHYPSVKGALTLRPSLLHNAKKNLKVLHPLPRVGEIDPRLDESPHAYYFQQAGNGVYTRQALIGLLTGMIN